MDNDFINIKLEIEKISLHDLIREIIVFLSLQRSAIYMYTNKHFQGIERDALRKTKNNGLNL